MKKRMAFILTLTFVVITLFSGCNAKTQPSSLSIVYTKRACSNATIPHDEICEAIEEICDNTGEVFIYSCDGSPRLINGYKVSKSYSKTSKGKTINGQIANEMFATLEGECVATTPEANILKAVHMVADSVKACNYNQNTLVIVDSMLTTADALDFTTYDLFNVDVESIIEQLKSNASLPDLSNVDVVVYNLGDVSLPQKEMTYSTKDKLEAIWKAIFEASNAKSVKFYTKPTVKATTNDVSLPSVGVVDIPEDVYVFEDVVLDDGQLGFVPDTAEFVDSDQAVEVLKSYVEPINKSQGVLLLGSTACVGENHNTERDLVLSQARADKVKDTLISLGVNSTKIESIGLGFDHPLRNPSDEQKNRSVTITDKQSDKAKLVTDYMKEGVK